MKTKLSLIIPTYNCIQYLEDTLRSVQRQLREDCELVLVDDGSTDGTEAFLEGLKGRQNNLIIDTGAHAGVSGARNRGLRRAGGEFVAFMDCDDLLMDGFFENSLPLLTENPDLVIFSYDRVEFVRNGAEGEAEPVAYPLTLRDRRFGTPSAFADEYIRDRHLLLYSACNKFYRKSILDSARISFRQGNSFGEDRLFNYDYLPHCGPILTSSVKMFQYMQRSEDSASNRHVPDYFRTVMQLHQAKTACLCGLSKGTTEAEKAAFRSYDLSVEIGRAVDRFALHPEEESENLPEINKIVFGEAGEPSGPFDIIVVLGSENCGYRVEKALEAGRRNPRTRYIVSGGNLHRDGKFTEAEYMAAFLKRNGIDEKNIFVENRARYTGQNLVMAAEIIQAIAGGDPGGLRTGIVTGGFHVPRTRALMSKISAYERMNVELIPAYGPNTRPDNWYRLEAGRKIILNEIAKPDVYGLTSSPG